MTQEQIDLMLDTWISKKPRLDLRKKQRFINMRDYNAKLLRPYRKNIEIKKDLFHLVMKCRERYLEKHCSYNNSAMFNHPKVFLVGADKNNILTTMIPIASNGGCHQMPKIDASSFAFAVTELISYNLTPRALLRIGIFYPYYTSTRGDVVDDLRKLSREFFLLSFGISYMNENNRFENSIYRAEQGRKDYNLIIKED